MPSYKRLLLSLASALLLTLPWWGCSGLWLTVAFVPLLLISRSYGSSARDFWRMYGWTALTLGVWSAANTWWVWIASPSGTIATTIIEMTLFAAPVMIYHAVSKRAKQSLAAMLLVCGWIAAEYLYLTGEISFPWLVLGNGFAREPWLVQWYSATGVFGGSLWVLLCNILVFNLLTNRSRSRIVTAAIWFAVPVVVSLTIYWSYREPAGEKVTATVVQPNFFPEAKFDSPQDTLNSIMLSLAAQAPAQADYIVLPETAIGNGENIMEHTLRSSRTVNRFADFVADNYPEAQLIVGATTTKLYPSESEASATARNSGSLWYDIYNTALAIDGKGSVGRHHKIKLVIGAEKMPYMNLLKPLEKLIVDLGGTTGQLGQDKQVGIFTLTDSRHPRPIVSGSPICYEAIYGEHTTRFVNAGAELLFVISNDCWWGDTPGYKWLFDYSRLRAIETRRWIARSANTGMSGFIDPRGDKLSTLGWDRQGTLTSTMTTHSNRTFYVRYGDYIARISNLLLLLGLLYFLAYRIRRRDHIVE